MSSSQGAFISFERLVEGVLYRRKRTLYHASHQRKLQHGTEPVFSPPMVDRVLKMFDNITSFEEQQRQHKTVIQSEPSKKAVTCIETTASTAIKMPLSTYGKYVVLTGITMSQAGRRQALDIPPTPRPLGTNVEEIKCPYCSHLITEELGKNNKMRSTR
jgi:hypothetical protein